MLTGGAGQVPGAEQAATLRVLSLDGGDSLRWATPGEERCYVALGTPASLAVMFALSQQLTR